MDSTVTVIVSILSAYAPDKGAALGRSSGPMARDRAKEIADLVLDRVKKLDARTAQNFMDNPAGYTVPLGDALNEIVKVDAGLAARLQAMLEQYEAVSGGPAMRDVYKATAAGSGAVAQGPGATAAGEGAQIGGIRAGRIEADNVVDGVQLQGATPTMAANLVELARSIQRGGISAEEIKAGNVVEGLQFLSGKAPATPDDLRREVAALRKKLDEAIAAGELDDPTDAKDAQDALENAEKELADPNPKGNRVARKLGEVSEILVRGAEVAQAAGKVGWQIIRLAPVAMALRRLAEIIF